MAQPKHATINELETELSTLQAQRLAIDLDALTQRRDDATANFSRYAWPESAKNDAAQAARLAAGHAENALSNGKLRAAELDGRIAPLTELLDSQTRTAEAEQVVEQAAGKAAAAAEIAAAAQQAVDQLGVLLSGAAAEHAQDLDAAARDALRAVKQGMSPGAAAVDRSQVAALEAALVLAQTELAAATTAKTDADKAVDEVTEQLRAAQADAARLHFELHLRAFAQVVVQYRRAIGNRSHYLARDFPADEVRQAVNRIQAGGVA